MENDDSVLMRLTFQLEVLHDHAELYTYGEGDEVFTIDELIYYCSELGNNLFQKSTQYNGKRQWRMRDVKRRTGAAQ
jgi:hypothetical protein